MTKLLEVHPAAEIFPLMEGDDFDSLCKSIKEHGQQHACELYEGKLLDGRNRYLACEKLGIDYAYCNITKGRLNGLSPLEYIIAANLERRHLTVTQRAKIAAKSLPKLEAEAEERMKAGVKPDPTDPGPEGDAADRAGRVVGVSGKSVRRAAKILDKGSSDLIDAVEKGDIGLKEGEEIAALPKAKQRKRVAAKNGAATNGKPKTEAGKMVDGLKKTVPAKFIEVFEARAIFNDILNRLNKIQREVEELASDPGGACISFDGFKAELSNAKSELRFRIPHTTCPKCKTGKSGCNVCKSNGWVPKKIYDQLVKEQKRGS